MIYSRNNNFRSRWKCSRSSETVLGAGAHAWVEYEFNKLACMHMMDEVEAAKKLSVNI